AEELEPDLIVVGSRGLSGLKGFLLGSVARNVAKHASCPVLVARGPASGLRRIVLAVDDSDHAARAVAFASRLPLPAEAEITVASVARPYDPHPSLFLGEPEGLLEQVGAVRERRLNVASALVDRAHAQLEGARRRVSPRVLEGDPAEEILGL